MQPDRTEPDAGESPLLLGLRLLRDRWWVLVLAGLLGLGAALATSLRQPALYSSTATLVLVDDAGQQLLEGGQSAGTTDPQRRAQTELALLQSPRIATQVVRALDYEDAPEDVAAGVDVTLDAESDVIDVTASDQDPVRAAEIANQWAAQYELTREESRRAQYQQLIPVLQRQIRQATSDGVRGPLRTRLREVEQAAAYTQAGVDLYSRAQAADTPSSPAPKRDGALGLLLGLGVGLALIFVVDVFDRRVRRPEDLEELYGMRALTILPERPRRAGFGAADLEALRILRGNLTYLALAAEVRVVLVTSAVAGEGKTSVAAGLANVAANGGEDVLLVEADLRRPAAATALGATPGRPGLSEVLAGDAFADHVDAPVPGLQKLHFLPAGRPPANPADVLRGTALPELLAEASERYDLVIVDLPPLLPVVDAQLLLDLPDVDACVVVARANRTTRAEVRRARAILGGHRQTRLGLVVNGAARSDVVTGYGYAGQARGRLGRRGGAGDLPAGDAPMVVDATPDDR